MLVVGGFRVGFGSQLLVLRIFCSKSWQRDGARPRPSESGRASDRTNREPKAARAGREGGGGREGAKSATRPSPRPSPRPRSREAAELGAAALLWHCCGCDFLSIGAERTGLRALPSVSMLCTGASRELSVLSSWPDPDRTVLAGTARRRSAS